jgi:hypothetical protein
MDLLPGAEGLVFDALILFVLLYDAVPSTYPSG